MEERAVYNFKHGTHQLRGAQSKALKEGPREPRGHVAECLAEEVPGQGSAVGSMPAWPREHKETRVAGQSEQKRNMVRPERQQGHAGRAWRPLREL